METIDGLIRLAVQFTGWLSNHVGGTSALIAHGILHFLGVRVTSEP